MDNHPAICYCYNFDNAIISPLFFNFLTEFLYLVWCHLSGVDPGFPMGAVDPFGGCGPLMRVLFGENVCENEKDVHTPKSLSVKINIFASLGISILIPDMPVTSVFFQSMIICLKIQQWVSILTLSFGIGLDK